MTSAADIADIAALENRRYDAMVAADGAVLDELFDDRSIYTHSSGTTDTKTEYIESLTSGRLTYHSIERTDQEITMYANTAVVKVGTKLQITNAGGDRTITGQGTAVWIREGGPWRFITWHSTPVVAH
jgi:Domain of unknown function (DUF4440)